MALIEYDAYKQKLRDLEPELKKLGDALDIDAVAQEAARLEDETTQEGADPPQAAAKQAAPLS